jgi:threonine/homoserine/homoserine lactone efflux protein
LDPARLTVWEVGQIAAITVVAVGGVKAAYALLAARVADRALGPRGTRLVHAGTGGLLIAAGGTIAFKP